MAQQPRRMRVRRRRGAVVGPNGRQQKELDDKLESIAEHMREIERHQAALAQAHAEMHTLMDRYTVKHHAVDGAEANIVRPQGRSSSYIAPAELYEALGGDDETFYECVEVRKGKAGEHLSGKELEAITETTPGKIKDPQLDVKLTPKAEK